MSAEEHVPACVRCRQRRAKCSREQPCAECARSNSECIYNERRFARGLRIGAVEQLSNRVEALENMFLGQGMLWQKIWQSLQSQNPRLDFDSSTNGFARELEDLASKKTELKATLLRTERSVSSFKNAEEDKHQDKRRKRDNGSITDSDRSSDVDNGRPGVRTEDQPIVEATLPPDDIVDELVKFYFASVHHWIPILHVQRFQEQIRDAQGRRQADLILRAIIATCVRFSSDSRLDDRLKSQMARTNRQIVILRAMESFSVESLQALVIVAFETIGSDRGPSSWSIIGSMTRTVEQLRLSVEEDRFKDNGETLIRRMMFLQPSQSWLEAEERRRVFWTVFQMDRFCSVSTGWNISLTGADVQRRLPCEGTFWARNQMVMAPYFGISDNGLNSDTKNMLAQSEEYPESEDRNCIGGFAYCIEATESLALVTNFFLHEGLDVTNAKAVKKWLTTFKLLDLRFVQWKIYLPEKWREASVLNQDGIMDPNLTLAHITHNTAIILLHQGVAYPPPHWKNCPVKLPTATSMETCIQAASEIAAISYQFLRYSPIITSPQFAFCMFIAGRLFLTHSRYNMIPISSELDVLVQNLMEMSRRWSGNVPIYASPNDDPMGSWNYHRNLASMFAKRLIDARNNKNLDGPFDTLDIRKTAYSETMRDKYEGNNKMDSQVQKTDNNFDEKVDNAHALGVAEASKPISQAYPLNEPSYDSIERSFSLAFPPLPESFVPSNSDLYLMQNAQNAGLVEPEGSDNLQIDYAHMAGISLGPDQRISRYGRTN